MIKAIIFDCFGVLATEGWEPFCYKHFGDDRTKASRAKELAKQLNLGFIDYDNFIGQVSTLAGVTEAIARKIIDKNVPNKPLFDYIKADLKPNYKIGLLSNAGGNWLNKIFTDEQLVLIDDYILSYAESVIKPQTEIYELMAQKLGVKSTECVMIDDRQRHVDGAKNAGMEAIIYEDFGQMKGDLGKIILKQK